MNKSDSESVAELLMRSGADVTITDKRGRTANQTLVRRMRNMSRNFDGSKYPKQAEVLGRWKTEFPKVFEAAKRGEFRNKKMSAVAKPFFTDNTEKNAESVTVTEEKSAVDAKTAAPPKTKGGYPILYIAIFIAIVLSCFGITQYIKRRRQ